MRVLNEHATNYQTVSDGTTTIAKEMWFFH